MRVQKNGRNRPGDNRLLALCIGVLSLVILLCSCSEMNGSGMAVEDEKAQGKAGETVIYSFDSVSGLQGDVYLPSAGLIDEMLSLCDDAMVSAYRGGCDADSPGLSSRLSLGEVTVGSPIPVYHSPRAQAGILRSGTDLLPVFCDEELVGIIGCSLDEKGHYSDFSAFDVTAANALRGYVECSGEYAAVMVEGQNPFSILLSPEAFAGFEGSSFRENKSFTAEELEACRNLIEGTKGFIEFSSGKSYDLSQD